MLPEARSIAKSAKRVALIGLLALASHAVLPYVHFLTSRGCGGAGCGPGEQERAPSHSADCAVCGAIAHAGGRAVDAPAAVAELCAPLAREAAAQVVLAHPPAVARATASARAPPASVRPA
jgi:hypothetical protein